MKKIFFGISLAIIVLIAVIIYTLQPKAAIIKPLIIAPFPESTGGTLEGKIIVTTQTGPVIIADPKRISNMNDLGSGLYQMEGTHTDSEAGFSIAYLETEKSFAVDIWKQPLNEYRKQAGQYLIALLKISEEEACKLNVYVGTTYDVDPTLSGKNLGLSFCPDAIPL